MHLRSRRDHPEPEPLWRRVDRAAREMNPSLLILAVGLVILYLTCLLGLLIRLPITRISDNSSAAPSTTAESVGR